MSDWSKGVWQEVRRIQELRKSCVHKFASLAEMFPESVVGDDAIIVVREAIAAICDHASVSRPDWIDFDESLGWSGRNGASDTSTATLTTGGVSPADPAAIKVCFVTDGIEHVSSIHPQDFDYASEVDHLLGAVQVPITAIRVYRGPALERELLVKMRGNA